MWYKLSDQCCIRNGDRHTSHGNRFPVDASGLIGQGDNLLDVLFCQFLFVPSSWHDGNLDRERSEKRHFFTKSAISLIVV